MSKEGKQDVKKGSGGEAHVEKAGGEQAPSMEEILKSIRGVISGEEDGTEADAKDAKDEAEADSEDDDDILELTDMAEDETSNNKEQTEVEAEAAENTENGDDDKSVLDDIDDALKDELSSDEEATEEVVAEDNSEDEMAAAMAAETAEVEEEKPAEDSAEDDVFDAIAETKAPEEKAAGSSGSNSERLLKDKVANESSETLKNLVANLPRSQIDSPYTAGGITLEQLTIEAMRPFLAEWLNANLPTIVKQIVTKEIKKLIPEDED